MFSTKLFRTSSFHSANKPKQYSSLLKSSYIELQEEYGKQVNLLKLIDDKRMISSGILRDYLISYKNAQSLQKDIVTHLETILCEIEKEEEEARSQNAKMNPETFMPML